MVSTRLSETTAVQPPSVWIWIYALQGHFWNGSGRAQLGPFTVPEEFQRRLLRAPCACCTKQTCRLLKLMHTVVCSHSYANIVRIEFKVQFYLLT